MAKKVNIALDENTKIMIFVGGVALLALIISFNVLGFYNKKVDDLQHKIIEAKKILALREDISKISDAKNEYAKYVYKGLDRAEFRNTISALARESGVDIISIQPEKSQSVGVFKKISFSVKLKASYNEIGNFLAKIESYHLVTKIDALTIDNKTNESQYGRLGTVKKEDLFKKDARVNVSVTISAYSLASK